MPTHPLCRHIVRNTVLLATISLAAIGTAKRDFSVYNSCQECLAGGYGWSLKKSRCGNYVMRDLSRCPHQAEPAASSAKEASVSRDSFPMSSQAASGATHDHDACADDRSERNETPLLTPQARVAFRAVSVPVIGGKWGKYFTLRSQALANYQPCAEVDCYSAILANDLAPWNQTGITKDVFEATRTYNMGPKAKAAGGGGRMNHYQIIKGKLFGSAGCPSRSARMSFHARCEGIEHTLLELLAEDRKHRASKRKRKRGFKPIPDVEFVINVQDKPQMAYASSERGLGLGGTCLGPDDKKKLCTVTPLPLMSFSKPQAGKQSLVEDAAGVPVGGPFWDIMYPAWTFWGGGPNIKTEPVYGVGRWDLKSETVYKAGVQTPWKAKIPKAFFRGSRTTYQRDPLMRLTKNRPDLAHAHYTFNPGTGVPMQQLIDIMGQKPATEASFEEHCKYKYLFNFKGMAASFRYKHLFLCNSLVFHVGNTGNDFVEFFYEALVPWVHYIPIDQEMSDLEEKLEFARQNDDIAKEIAQAGMDFIRTNLQYKHIKQYWRKLLTEYAALQRYEVQPAADCHPISTRNHRVVDKK